MTWNWGRGLTVAGTALGIVATLACSSSDPIQPNNGNLMLQAENAPVYADTYQWVRFQIDQITVRPLDPLSNSYLTSAPLGLLAGPVPVNVRTAGATTIASVPVKAGTYRVEQVRISGFSLNVDPVAPIDAVACSNGELVSARADGITLVEFNPAPVIQIAQGGATPVALTIDGPGLVTMLTSLPFNCFSPPFPTPTSAQLVPFLSVN